MLAGLCNIVAELLHQLKANHIIVICYGILSRNGRNLRILLTQSGRIGILYRAFHSPTLDFRIQIFSVAGNLQQPCHMVNTGDFVIQTVLR